MKQLAKYALQAVGLSVLCAAANILPAQTLTTLFTFEGPNGAFPLGALIQARDGNLYGTTWGSCNNFNYYGTVFKITPAGSLTTLHNFCMQSGCADGYGPEGALVEAADGNFYGTTAFGGSEPSGTVFKITSDGALTTVHSFCTQSNCTDGVGPAAGLVYANGALYGTTAYGGAHNGGTVFKITGRV